jgi:hypothetical protein
VLPYPHIQQIDVGLTAIGIGTGTGTDIGGG